eukprot:scaffold176625_cov19-Tisochrysis_lutea.AAC.1
MAKCRPHALLQWAPLEPHQQRSDSTVGFQPATLCDAGHATHASRRMFTLPRNASEGLSNPYLSNPYILQGPYDHCCATVHWPCSSLFSLPLP